MRTVRCQPDWSQTSTLHRRWNVPKLFVPISSMQNLTQAYWSRLNLNEVPDHASLLRTSPTAANTAHQGKYPLTAEYGIVDSEIDILRKQRVTLVQLIRGVYELQYRRLQGTYHQRSPSTRSLWESVHFELLDEFEDGNREQPNKNIDIDLAVYKWNPNSYSAGPSRVPPTRRVVIAVRGTLPSMDDGWHNFQGSLQCLHLTSRYQKILKVVKSAIQAHGSDEICIAGHSLGATLGLLVARSLATNEGIKIDSHLFNPVYAYTWFPTPDKLLQSEQLWRTMRALRCATVAGMAKLLIDDASRTKIGQEYAELQNWTPHIYINTGDPICRGYWEYFTNHELLARNGVLGAYLANLSAPFSGRGLLTTSLGSKPLHLVPSAVLHICDGVPPFWLDTDLISDRNRYSNHNLSRWMEKDLRVSTREVGLSCW